MTACHATTSNDWSLPRTVSLAGAVSVHVFAMRLLAMPAMRPTTVAAIAETVQVIWHEPEPEPVAQPLPPEPKPLPVPKRPATPAPVVIETPLTEMSIPAPVVEPAPLVDAVGIEAPVAVDAEPGRGVDVNLDYASRTALAYPKASARNHEQGTVLLRVHVDAEGRPVKIEIVRSSGHDRLDRAARDGVREWRFRPVQRNGIAVPASGLVPVAFSMAQG